MPTYDYLCQDCNHTHEKIVKIADSHNPQECPKCQSTNSVKQVGAPKWTDPERLNANAKMPDDFKNLLKKIHDSSPGSRMRETSNISF